MVELVREDTEIVGSFMPTDMNKAITKVRWNEMEKEGISNAANMLIECGK